MKSTEEMLQAAVQQLQTAEQARLTSETDPARRQLLHLLYAREAAALQSMTLVRAEIPAAQKRNWKPLIFPLAATVLNLGALALWLTLPSCVTPEKNVSFFWSIPNVAEKRLPDRCAVGITLRRHREHCERHAPQAPRTRCGGG